MPDPRAPADPTPPLSSALSPPYSLTVGLLPAPPRLAGGAAARGECRPPRRAAGAAKAARLTDPPAR
eukprot:6686377-Prymnesium_polylepis.1